MKEIHIKVQESEPGLVKFTLEQLPEKVSTAPEHRVAKAFVSWARAFHLEDSKGIAVFYYFTP